MLCACQLELPAKADMHSWNAPDVGVAVCLPPTGQRITTAMYKYYSHKNQLSAAGNALLLARSFRQRLWDNSQQQVGMCSIHHPAAASILFFFVRLAVSVRSASGRQASMLSIICVMQRGAARSVRVMLLAYVASLCTAHLALQVRQLKNVTKPIAEKLAAAGLGGLRDVLEMDPHNCNRLQAAAGK
jgi:hypothetical protein